MRDLATALLLVTCSLAFAGADCETSMTCGDWTTQAQFKTGSATLHWTHVYEGRDSVYQVSYAGKTKKQVTYKVAGQPIVNLEHGLIAFVGCADDGCTQELSVLDLVKGKVVAGDLPVGNSQFYLTAEWSSNALIVTVEDFADRSDAPRVTKYTYTVGRTLDCSKGIQQGVPADVREGLNK